MRYYGRRAGRKWTVFPTENCSIFVPAASIVTQFVLFSVDMAFCLFFTLFPSATQTLSLVIWKRHSFRSGCLMLSFLLFFFSEWLLLSREPGFILAWNRSKRHLGANLCFSLHFESGKRLFFSFRRFSIRNLIDLNSRAIFASMITSTSQSLARTI